QEQNHDQQQNGERGMVEDQVFGPGDDLGPEDHSKNRKNTEANEPAANDRQQEEEKAHFKNSGGEDKELEGSRRRQHCRDHQGQELLAFKAVADAPQLGLIDTLEQKQLTPGAA